MYHVENYLINSFAKELAKRVMKALRKAKTTKKANEDIEKRIPMSLEEYRRALSGIGLELEYMEKIGSDGVRRPTRKIYENSIKWVGKENGFDLSMNAPDIAVLEYYQNKYFPPTFERLTTGTTPYNYKNTIKSILDKGISNHWDWKKITREMESFLNVGGKNFPRFMYTRIMRTELARFVTEGHIRGHMKIGYTKFRRLEIEDLKINEDLCLPFSNHIYDAKIASGIIPAHPNCRGDMTPES